PPSPYTTLFRSRDRGTSLENGQHANDERTDPSGQRPCEKDSQWYGDHQRDECRHRGEDDVLLESRADRPDVERALLDRVELPALHVEEEPEVYETEVHRNREVARPRPAMRSRRGLGDHACTRAMLS